MNREENLHHLEKVINILLVDDHQMTRHTLTYILNDYEDLVVSGEAADGLEAIEMCSRKRPDIVLMDINMPKMDGIEATRKIIQEHPEVKVIILSNLLNNRNHQNALQAGAHKLLHKNISMMELVRAIRSVMWKDISRLSVA